MSDVATKNVTVTPGAPLRGELAVPGDKSISHRVAMLAALADGPSTVSGFLDSEDCLNTVAAVAALGARVERTGPGALRIEGTGGRFRVADGVLDMGNSGTGMRLLAGLLAGQPFTTELTGDASLRSRPMGRIREPLERMGARIELLGANGCAPVRIAGGGLKSIEYVLPVASAQVKSCTLLAGLFADGETVVVEPKPTRDHTERLLSAMGAELAVDGLRVSVRGAGAAGPALRAGHWVVPGDTSSAAFWLGAAAAMPGADVTIRGVGLNPRRTAFLDVLRRMGAELDIVAFGGGGGTAWEACGDVRVRGTRLHGTVVAGAEIPNLIDELPLISVLGCLADGQTVIADAAELRVKESDRIRTMAENLRGLGQAVEERPDGMVVTGGAVRSGGRVASYGDHRVAMSLAVYALCADGAVCVGDVACVRTSYPEFWTHLKTLGGEHDV